MARPFKGGPSPVAFVRAYVEQGLSARQFLRDFRAAGAKIDNNVVRALFIETREAMGRVADTVARDTTRLPRDEELATWSTYRGGGFATTLTYIRREEGEDALTRHQFAYMSRDRHSIDEAIGALVDTLTPTEGDESEYRFEVLGVVPVNQYRIERLPGFSG